jgi:hypothetical protein
VSIRIARASAQGLSRTSAPDYNAAYTVCGWWYYTSLGFAGGFYGNQLVTLESGNPADNLDLLQSREEGGDHHRLNIQVGIGAGLVIVVGTTNLSTGTWYYQAMVRSSATSVKIYLGTTAANIAEEAENTTNVTGRTASTALHMGEFWTNELDGRMAAVRVYTRALTLDQLKVEAVSASPVDASNIWATYPFRTRERDVSGNARHLTPLNGPLTVEADPPDVHNWPPEWAVLPRNTFAWL